MNANDKTIVVANFPITADVALTKRGAHNNITYEITNHGRRSYDIYSRQFEPSMGTWCYYIMITEQMLPPESFAEFWLEPQSNRTSSSGAVSPIYSYHGAKFAEADWHGGVTFYAKRGGIDDQVRWVKIGCDFAHLWDEGREFDLDGVECEAKRTIDQLMQLYEFHSKCPYSGKWQPASAMVEHEGKLYSASGLEKMLAYNAEPAGAA